MTRVQTRIEPYVSGRGGRNSAPQGEFSGFFLPIGTALRCTTFIHFARSRFGLLRSQSAIYWLLQGLGDLEKFRGHPGPETGQKRRKNGFSWSWGPLWAKRLPTKVDCMLNADCLGSHVSLGPEIWPFF